MSSFLQFNDVVGVLRERKYRGVRYGEKEKKKHIVVYISHLLN